MDIESKEGRENESGGVLLAVAHGTREAAGVGTVSRIIEAVRARAQGVDVRTAWIEIVQPDLPTALAALPPGRPVTLVPLLVSSGYHDRVDLPRAVEATRPDAVRARVLGPDPLLAVALADRLAEAGWQPTDAVVLAGAGSSDADAVASVRTQASLLGAELRTRTGEPMPVRVGFASAAAPDVATAVAEARAGGVRRVVVAAYLLAPGFFLSRMRESGADLVAEPLGAHPAVVELVLRRHRETLA